MRNKIEFGSFFCFFHHLLHIAEALLGSREVVVRWLLSPRTEPNTPEKRSDFQIDFHFSSVPPTWLVTWNKTLSSPPQHEAQIHLEPFSVHLHSQARACDPHFVYLMCDLLIGENPWHFIKIDTRTSHSSVDAEKNVGFRKHKPRRSTAADVDLQSADWHESDFGSAGWAKHEREREEKV